MATGRQDQDRRDQLNYSHCSLELLTDPWSCSLLTGAAHCSLELFPVTNIQCDSVKLPKSYQLNWSHCSLELPPSSM